VGPPTPGLIGDIMPAPEKMHPMELAERLVLASRHEPAADSDEPPFPTLWWWAGTFWHWTDGHYVPENLLGIEDLVIMLSHRLSLPITTYGLQETAKVLKAFQNISGPQSLPFWLKPSPVLGGAEILGSASTDYLATPTALIRPLRLAAGDSSGWQDPTPRWFSTTQLPYDYDPEAVCPVWESWLDERLESDAQRISLLQEYMGYLLTADTSRHVALVLFGDAATGKSTVGKMIQAMIGEQNCSSLPLPAFGRRFGLSDTVGKLVNIADESVDINQQAESALKWFVSGGHMTVDRKYLPLTPIRPTARLVCCMNSWPEFKDQSGGWNRRLLVVPFRRRLAFQDQDSRLEDRLTTEAAGVFNWALQGLHRLTTNGGFTTCDLGLALTADARCQFQSPTEFARRFVKPEQGCWTSNEDLYAAYFSWCKQQDWKVQTTKGGLGRLVAYHHNTTVQQKQMPDGTRPRGVVHVRLLDLEEQEHGQ